MYSNLVITPIEVLSSSYVFVAPKRFFTDFFIPDVGKINDSQNYYFEKYLYDRIVDWVKAGQCHSFFKHPLKIVGNGATDGQAYYTPKRFEKLLTLIRYLRRRNFVKNRSKL